MATQPDASDLSAQIEADHRAVVRERLRLAAMREERERRREIEAAQAQADEDALHAMGVIVWVLAGLGIACLALIAFLLPWAALLQWAATGDTGRYLLTLLAFGALIVGGLLWRARK